MFIGDILHLLYAEHLVVVESGHWLDLLYDAEVGLLVDDEDAEDEKDLLSGHFLAVGLLCELGLSELDYLGGEAVYLEVGRGQEGLAGFYLG